MPTTLVIVSEMGSGTDDEPYEADLPETGPRKFTAFRDTVGEGAANPPVRLCYIYAETQADIDAIEQAAITTFGGAADASDRIGRLLGLTPTEFGAKYDPIPQ